MNTLQIPAVAPRRPGEPEPDLTALHIIHRAMLGDLRRLARADEAGQDAAVRRYTGLLLTEIHHHHVNEDELVWPVVERTAGEAVDLTVFTDDHRALTELLDRCRTVLGGELPQLRRALGELHEMLAEHILDEEREVFPIIRRYVPAAAYQWCEDQVGRRAERGQLLFTVPWLAGWASREELDNVLSRAGARFRLLLAVTRGRYRRLERAAFGRPRPTP